MVSEVQYAVDRSHQNHKDSADFAKATGHAVILINGGAATAVLAYLTKDKMDVQTARALALSLIGFSTGVCFGAATLLFMVFSKDWWQEYWANEDTKLEFQLERKAVRWGKSAAICVGLSLGCFFVTSLAVAIRVYVSL